MGIYDRAWRDPPSVEGTPKGAVGPQGFPRHARWIPTREVVYPIYSSCTKVLALLDLLHHNSNSQAAQEQTAAAVTDHFKSHEVSTNFEH